MWLSRLVGVAIAGLFGVPVLIWLATPSAAGPANLGRPIDDFGAVLATQLDQPPLTHIRFVRPESDGEGTLILVFELRRYPYVSGRLAYLATRCVPPPELRAWAMAGGFVHGTTETDPELIHLRSDAQRRCLPDRIASFAPG